MIDKDEVMQAYGFSYMDCNGKTYEKVIKTTGATWTECMNDYVRFLESVFQYEIMPKVRLQEPIWLSTMYEHHHIVLILGLVNTSLLRTKLLMIRILIGGLKNENLH